MTDPGILDVPPDDEAQQDDADDGVEEGLRALVCEGRVACAFQPIVRVEAGDVVGYEAVCRPVGWPVPHSVRALFLLAERMGLERELSRASLRAAVNGARELGTGTLLFVHAPQRVVLGDKGALAEVLAVLHEFDLRPGDVVLQVAAQKLGGADAARELAFACHASGLRIALTRVTDAEGSGNAFAAARPDYIKLTPAVIGSTPAPRLRTMAAALGVAAASIIADGIATRGAMQAALEAGIGLAQGDWVGPLFRDAPSWAAGQLQTAAAGPELSL